MRLLLEDWIKKHGRRSYEHNKRGGAPVGGSNVKRFTKQMLEKAITDNPGYTADQLADVIGCNTSTVSAMLVDMRRDGEVTWGFNENRGRTYSIVEADNQ